MSCLYQDYFVCLLCNKMIDMTRELFLEGIGWVLETTYFRRNVDGVVEPYTEYEIIKPL
jgi:hypothetical protein